MNKALWHLSSTESQLKEIITSEDPNSLLLTVKSLYSLISTGSEYLVASGQVPPALFQSMRVPNMSGSFEFPLTYGYSLVGEVLLGEDALIGKKVHLLNPHQDFCQIKKEEIFLIPENVSPKRATLASNLETAVTALWDGNVQVGDRILIVGFGMIGALLGRLISFLPAMEVLVIETNEYRKKFAEAMGFVVKDKLPEKNKFDISFHSSGTNEGLQSAIDGVGMEGKIIELSWYGTRKTQIELGADFHQKRKQLICSQVSHIPAVKSSRWDYRRRKEVVFSLLANPLFDEHITREVPFEESPVFFQRLRKRTLEPGMGWCIAY